jgi:hypothetical protein
MHRKRPSTGKVFLIVSNPSIKEAVAKTELRLNGRLIVDIFKMFNSYYSIKVSIINGKVKSFPNYFLNIL